MYTESGSFSVPGGKISNAMRKNNINLNLLRTTNISKMLTMQSCFKALRILISRSAVTGMPSFSLCIRIRFRATTFPVDF